MSESSEQSRELMRRITAEIWDEGLIVAESDIAVSYGRNVGTNTGEFMGMPPTGKTIDVLSFGMLRFKDGQAIERWGFADSMAMMQQLGLLG